MSHAGALSERLADHVVGLQLDRVPAGVIDHAKRLIVDTIGVAWAGAAAPGSAGLEDLLLTQGGRAESTAWTSGSPTDAASAAFLNSVHAAALDYDSVFERGSVHPDIVSVPVAWAMAERQQASGREFLTAVILGNDLMCRLGEASEPVPGWFNTSLFGVFAAAAAAARLLGLEAPGVQDALGLALSQAGGTQQALIEKTLAKRIQSGLATRAGVFSALLAGHGITAPKQSFEGEFGLHRMYCGGDPEVLLGELGSRFPATRTAIKSYPGCTANHAPVEIVIGLMRELDLAPEDVLSIRARISPSAHRLVGGRFEPGDSPQVAAQFSLQYSLACAVLHRRLGVAEIQDQAVRSPAAAAFVDRVSVEIDSTNTGRFAPAEVIVSTTRHGEIRRRLEHVPGGPEAPPGWDRVAEKLRLCAAAAPRLVSEQRCDQIIRTVRNIEHVPDMSRVLQQLSGDILQEAAS